jgi:transaldolase
MNYLAWLNEKTQTKWWHDSAVPSEMEDAIKGGALGVTTNPVLTYKALQAAPVFWRKEVDKIEKGMKGTQRVEALLKIVATYAADKFKPIYEATNGQHGYAFAQVSPALAGNTRAMLEQGLRYASWGENIAVKLPTFMAALPVIEELASRGIAVCTTLNFSVSQAIAAAMAYEKGVAKAKAENIPVKPCFVVQQSGRLDDYLMEVAQDNRINLMEDDIQNAGNAVCKRSYALFQEAGYSAVIMPAGLRGAHHLSVMAGAKMVFSLQTRVQRIVKESKLPQIELIDEPIDPKSIERLMKIDEFVRAYQPDGLKEQDFIKFGVAQKTLSQFLWTGWAPLENYGCSAKSDRWF